MIKKPLVGIIMGSESDFSVMEEALKILDLFSVEYDVTISSAHRTPEKTSEFSRSARERGIEVIIAGAGFAAHLAGVIASATTLPVIGVPIDSSPLHGLDSLLSTVQMPGGVPVASMSIGKTGAKNAAIFAVQILSLKYPQIYEKLINYKNDLRKDVEKKERILKNKLKRK
jgi:phosphoribosylaminoimidazole carboxylase PurE protein